MPADPTPSGEPLEFVDDDLSGAVFREVDLSGARMTGVLLIEADIDGVIEGLVVKRGGRPADRRRARPASS